MAQEGRRIKTGKKQDNNMEIIKESLFRSKRESKSQIIFS